MSKVKIMLDPGHDKAKYNQSPVVPAYWEGARMWRLSQFLRLALVAKGFEVGCTKSKCDQSVTVTQRGAKARGYDALISLHSNACGTESVDRPVGIHFVDDDCGKIDGQSEELAKLLSKTVAKVMGTSQAQQYSKLSKNDRDHDGKKNDDHYGVLFASHHAGVPAVILEHSFHTNKRAAQWLMSDANLRKLAEAEADALADYFKVEPQSPIITTPISKEDFEVKVSVLKRGDKGDEVKALQAHLIGYGYSVGTSGIDGSFGPATEKALKAYQKDHGLEVDGSRGPATFASMNGR